MRSRSRPLLAIVVAVSGCGGAAAPTPIVEPTAAPATVEPRPTFTQAVPLDGQVAFVAGGDPQIYLLDLASGAQRQLTSLRPEDGTPMTAAGPLRPALSCGFGPFGLTWSPDGSLLAFHYGACEGVIWTVDVDGNAVRIADGTAPAWTRDGTSLVFSPNRPWDPCGFGCQGDPPAPGAWDLQVVEITGGAEPRPLTDDGATVAASGAIWSPDGALVAFSGPAPAHGPDIDAFSAVYVLTADGSGRRLVARGAWPFGWLPDGRLLFIDEQSGRLRAIDLVTNEAEAIGGADRVVAMSPRGDVFVANTNHPATGAERGRIVEMDGRLVAELPGPGGSFSPDGMWVLSTDGDGSEIVVHDLAGGVVARHETPGNAWAGNLRWRP